VLRQEVGLLGIFDIHGKLLISKQIFDKNTILDLKNLEAGVYFIRIVNSYNHKTKKLIKL
jgi:hypothetical protein